MTSNQKRRFPIVPYQLLFVIALNVMIWGGGYVASINWLMWLGVINAVLAILALIWINRRSKANEELEAYLLASILLALTLFLFCIFFIAIESLFEANIIVIMACVIGGASFLAFYLTLVKKWENNSSLKELRKNPDVKLKSPDKFAIIGSLLGVLLSRLGLLTEF